MRAIKINHVTLLVKNKIEAEKFYTQIMGLEKHQIGNSLWIRIGAQFLHITENSGEPSRSSFYHFGMEVENVHDYAQELISKGLRVFDLDSNLNEIAVNSELDKPQRQFFVRDIDNNLIELIEANSQFFNPTT